MPALNRICILGGGFGGLYTALHLSRYPQAQHRFQITLVDPKERFLFTPLFYEVLTDELKEWHVAPSFQELLAKTGINFCQDRADKIDFDRREVRLESNRVLEYDRLVLAMGQQIRLPPIAAKSDHLHTFRHLEDADRLRQSLHNLLIEHQEIGSSLQITVIGAGANGVELACKLADLVGNNGQIVLIDRRNTILKGFSISTQKAAHRALNIRNVRIILNTNIQSILPDRLVLKTRDKTYEISANLSIWAVGSQSWQWLEKLDCQQTEAGRLLTHSTLQLVDRSDVFALGDLASIQDDRNRSIPATAQAAFQQSQIAAYNLQASVSNRRLKSFRYLHLGEMLTLGINCAVVYCFGICLEGSIAFLIRRAIYLLRLPTIHHQLRVGTNWLRF
jgi:demethylphylloquinone reductase